ncbi:hypothetical protein LZ198_23355 [Myxococcus sp. K15C18031901]|uniref:hypothetical protein n=1 Tax=Myxococcus dinghuensis TaxID=2906761 RepID=UPI0020A8031D|nr:hypothetical protein [Myxococcus dinghuensis]MCP3101818.1 hypothetical protein [Myxococcus dinghuensis]
MPPAPARTDAAASRKNAAPQPPASPTELLERFERTLATSLGGLAAGLKPLLETVREGVKALDPGPGGARLSRKEREARCVQLEKAFERLEDVMEGLQLAARAQAGGKRD